ncbi:MAG: hypothetical protein H7834_13655 [Magnetococcus sp. YQC-9]
MPSAMRCAGFIDQAGSTIQGLEFVKAHSAGNVSFFLVKKRIMPGSPISSVDPRRIPKQKRCNDGKDWQSEAETTMRKRLWRITAALAQFDWLM